MKTWVNCAVVGCGSIYRDAHRHAFVNKFSTNLAIIGLCDKRKELVDREYEWMMKKLNGLYEKNILEDPEAAERYKYSIDHLKTYTDYGEMLKDLAGKLEMIDNCTHGAMHIPLSLQAMEAGYHAAAEKPPDIAWWGVKRVLEMEKSTGKYYQLNENVCYERNEAKMRELVQSGMFGKIKKVTASYGHGGPYDPYEHGKTGLAHFIDPVLSGGGVIQDLCVHGLAKALWGIYNPEDRVVSCETKVLERRRNPRVMSGNAYESPVDDYSEASLTLWDARGQNEYTVEMRSTWNGGRHPPLKIETDQGTITFGFSLLKKGLAGVRFKTKGSLFGKFYPIEEDDWEPRASHIRELQIFAQHIQQNRPSDTDGTFAHFLQSMLSIQYYSKLKGKRVTFEEMEVFGAEIAAKHSDPQEALEAIAVELTGAVDLL